jgi:DNA-directed RNA polymerase subunit RPC12/RpoP
MFCGNCGIKLKEKVNFCPQCGTKIIVSSFQKDNKINGIQPKIQNDASLLETISPITNTSIPKKINWILIISIAAITTIGIITVPKIINTQSENSIIPNVSLAVWKGYSSYESFAKAADMDEFLGRPLNEQGFISLMALAFFAQDGDKLSVDIVSGAKLTERYSVSETLRHNYNYLVKRSGIKGTTFYIAYFNGESWVVMYGKEE